jgi:hypothetical protein
MAKSDVWENIEKITQREELVFVAIGCFLLVVAGVQQISKFGIQVAGEPWRLVLAAAGGILLIYGLVSHFRKDRKAQQLELKDHANVSDKANIEILAPDLGSHVGNSFTVSGTYSSLPNAFDLYVFTGSKLSGKFWPQETARVDRTKKTWTGKVHNLGGKPDELREIYVFLVGEDGRALIHHYRKVGEASGWMPIDRLTRDMVFCKEATVRI